MRVSGSSGSMYERPQRANSQILYLAPCDLDSGMGGSARLTDNVNILRSLGLSIILLSYVSRGNLVLRDRRSGAGVTVVTVTVPTNWPRVVKAIFIPVLLLGVIGRVTDCDVIFC